MPSDWRTQFSQEALAKVDAFVAAHPGYTRADVEQPGQGATHRVFFARRDEELVVFKVFCEAERKERECFALCHWAQTGLVPALIWDADPRMIVMSHTSLLYHQDPSNLHVEQGRFVGFYDLEMCRVGGTAMQLASSLGMLKGEKVGWTFSVRAGSRQPVFPWAARTGRRWPPPFTCCTGARSAAISAMMGRRVRAMTGRVRQTPWPIE